VPIILPFDASLKMVIDKKPKMQTQLSRLIWSKSVVVSVFRDSSHDDGVDEILKQVH
jgi:hypothetical protein